MHSFKIFTLGVVALGMASGRNLQGSTSCHEIVCNVITKNNACVGTAANALRIVWGQPSVNGNSVTYVTSAAGGNRDVFCQEDPNTKMNCHQGRNVDCPGQHAPAPAPAPALGGNNAIPAGVKKH